VNDSWLVHLSLLLRIALLGSYSHFKMVMPTLFTEITTTGITANNGGVCTKATVIAIVIIA